MLNVPILVAGNIINGQKLALPRRSTQVHKYFLKQRFKWAIRGAVVYRRKSGLNATNVRTTSIYNSEQESDSGEIINHQFSTEEINRTRRARRRRRRRREGGGGGRRGRRRREERSTAWHDDKDDVNLKSTWTRHRGPIH